MATGRLEREARAQLAEARSLQEDRGVRIHALAVTREDSSAAGSSLAARPAKPKRIVVSNHVFGGIAVGSRSSKSVNITLGGGMNRRSFNCLPWVNGDSTLPSILVENALNQGVRQECPDVGNQATA